jgi:hypothetical protein
MAGLLSGAGGALVYALYCPENGGAVHRRLAILGALFGPGLLRW